MKHQTRSSSPKTSQKRSAALARDVKKNVPLGNDTEINERVTRHFGDIVPNVENEGLPIRELPRHMKTSRDDDENELAAALARRGAGDEGSGPSGD